MNFFNRKNARLVLFMASVLLCLNARAVIIANYSESDGDVIGVTTGSAILDDLSLEGTESYTPGIDPGLGYFLTGGSANMDVYTGLTTAPTFGPGGGLEASYGTGPLVGVIDLFYGLALYLPVGYVSGAELESDSIAIFAGESFSSLGMTPGQYIWNWGEGDNADSLVLNIGVVPEPSTYALIISALVGLFAFHRRVKISNLGK
ncbi:PEP-CTERM sorting domain-containing protein [Cerasicoccus frondis]|uniref:PEP-CTERM sorting domain-containing protein n=1 Tax=Cerasicoccus frondis TaxID=490090 RepID=UPI0028527C97|nr:PEP-CTERM sorting domain-containing protein [Cerasicoccus frondis]